MCKKVFVLIILSSLFCLHAQTAKYMLSNGLEVFIKAQTGSPVVSVDLCVRDGFISELKETAGFSDINTRLFWTNKQGTTQSIKDIGITNTSAQLTSHASIYSCSFPAFRSDEALELIKELVSTSIFDDYQLDRAAAEYAVEQREFTNSIHGIIQILVMEHMNPDEPWKQSRTMSYCYYQAVAREKMRAVLSGIRSAYYQPDNIALFISAPFTEEQMLNLVKKHFESWQGQGNQKKVSITTPAQTDKRTVFVSDGFPQNVEQYIVVYPVVSSGSKNESDSSAETISFILNSAEGIFKQNLTAQKDLGLEGADYIDISFEKHHEQSRLVFQSIMQKTTLSPGKKIEKMLSLLQNTTQFDDETLRNASFYKAAFESERENTIPNTIFIESWAQRKELPVSVIPASQHSYEILSQSPFVFVLLPTSDYELQKKDLEREGWTVIHEKDLRKKINERKTGQKPEEYLERIDSTPTEIRNLLIQQSQTVFKQTVSNGIEVVVNPGSRTQDTSIVIGIDGGVFLSKTDKILVEKVIMLYLENEIRKGLYELRVQGIVMDNFSISSSPGLISSSITINCSSKDSEAVFYGSAKALALADIKPAQADELLSSLAGSAKIAKFDVGNQLYSAAIESLFAGSLYEKALVSPNLETASYQFSEIKKAAGLLYNADRFSFYICTDAQTAPSIVPAVEKYFSFLHKSGSIAETVIEPVFSSITRWKSIQRIFIANASPEDAGQRPLKLIPTTVFLDPAQMYYKRPDNASQSVFDASIIALAEYLQKMNDAGTVRVFEKAEPYFDAEIPSLCGIYFSMVTSYTELQQMAAEAIESVTEWLNPEAIAIAKNSWVSMMSNSLTTQGKAQMHARGSFLYKNELHDIEQYAALESSSQSEFLTVFEHYILKQPALWILSSDTNR